MPLKVVLLEPEIPWNTGNIGRTCVAAGAELHLVGRLGFSLSERRLRRAGLDYWPKLELARHADFDSFEKSLPRSARVLAFSAQAPRTFWEAGYSENDYLLFGKESTGLPEGVLERFASFRVPMQPGIRSLNVSTTAAVVVFEALRQSRTVL